VVGKPLTVCPERWATDLWAEARRLISCDRLEHITNYPLIAISRAIRRALVRLAPDIHENKYIRPAKK
jgi:hypothetical protein